MKKIWKTLFICIMILGFFILVIQDFSKSLTDYGTILRLNWGLSLPSSSHYTEIYEANSGPSIHGDGIRYHVFSYEKEEPVENMISWQSEEQKTKWNGSYSKAVSTWLDQIYVPADQRPDFSQCKYWYHSKEDSSEIILLWEQDQERLYVVENIL